MYLLSTQRGPVVSSTGAHGFVYRSYIWAICIYIYIYIYIYILFLGLQVGKGYTGYICNWATEYEQGPHIGTLLTLWQVGKRVAGRSKKQRQHIN